MAKYVTESEFKRLVRVCLDENMSSEQLTALQDIDTLSLDELIESKAEDAALSVVRVAPVEKLGDVAQSLEGVLEISNEAPHKGHITLPLDYERLVRFKMKSWQYGVFVVQSPNTPQYIQANSEFNVYGTKDRPAVFLTPSTKGGSDLFLEFFCAGNTNDSLDDCLYVAKPKKEFFPDESSGGNQSESGGGSGDSGNTSGDSGQGSDGTSGNDEVLVTSIVLNKASLALVEGETEPLTATIYPSNASNKSVTWESSDTSVAVVENGVVMALEEGTCVITCSANDESGVDAECEVTVSSNSGGDDISGDDDEEVQVNSISLNIESLSLKVGQFYALKAEVNTPNSNYSVTFTSDNPAIAKVVYNGRNTCFIEGVSEGECSIRCEVNNSGGAHIDCPVLVRETSSDGGSSGSNSEGTDGGLDAGYVEGVDYVDLGLPSGTLWATKNLGANTPEGYGDYFKWAETTPIENYDHTTHKYQINDSAGVRKYTKYCSVPLLGHEGFVDNKLVLEDIDDAAIQNLEGMWRMPTKEQVEELIDDANTSFEMIMNGTDVDGFLIRSRINGKTIFFPAAGRYNSNIGDILRGEGRYVGYWTRNISYDSNLAYSLNFGSDYNVASRRIGEGQRTNGLSIRPVFVPPLPRGLKPIRIDSEGSASSGSGTGSGTDTGTSGTTSGNTWKMLIGDNLLRPTIYYAAYLTALAIKDDSAAEKLLIIAKDLLGINV